MRLRLPAVVVCVLLFAAAAQAGASSELDAIQVRETVTVVFTAPRTVPSGSDDYWYAVRASRRTSVPRSRRFVCHDGYRLDL